MPGRLARRTGMRPFAAGLLAVVLIAIAVYFAFSRSQPFNRSYTLKAAFRTANNLQLSSPVRIAGVNVGKVTKVERKDGSTAAMVEMKLSDEALPIHRDATIKIRPRIFLEGNFFLDLKPGSPSEPTLHSGSVVPMTQTVAPVQLDQVLSSLQHDTRAGLERLVQGYGHAIGGRPAPAEDRDQVPSVRGLTAGQALNRSLDYSPQALRGTALVNEALLGEQPHDLSRLIAGQQKVSSVLVRRESTLQDLVTSFNRTMAAFASEADALRRSVHVLPDVLTAAKGTLEKLNAAFPPTRAFAREILPGVRETPATINASFPWIAQTRRLLSQRELGGLVNDLRPGIHDLAAVTDGSVKLFPQVDLASRCMTGVVLPAGDVKLDDGPLSTGLANYKEFWQTMVGLSGESQNFDGNGQYTRFQPGGGDQTVSTGQVRGELAGTKLFGNAALKPIGTRPAMPASVPPFNRRLPCFRNPVPNLSATTGGAP